MKSPKKSTDSCRCSLGHLTADAASCRPPAQGSAGNGSAKIFQQIVRRHKMTYPDVVYLCIVLFIIYIISFFFSPAIVIQSALLADARTAYRVVSGDFLPGPAEKIVKHAEKSSV